MAARPIRMFILEDSRFFLKPRRYITLDGSTGMAYGTSIPYQEISHAIARTKLVDLTVTRWYLSGWLRSRTAADWIPFVSA
jgi:hypothetical protein